MDKEILYSAVMRRFGVRRFAAKAAADWWLKFHSTPGMYLKGAFESPLFLQRLEVAQSRGHHSPKRRCKLRERKAQESA